MANILVVDDEYLLVQGVIDNIDWNALGIDHIFSAYSVKQAQQIYEKESVDILLADIEMPHASGLDLIRWARDQNYTSINLLLTGHANFKYAQEAIGMQVFRYVLKPTDLGELNQALKDAMQLLLTSSQTRSKELGVRLQKFWHDLYRQNITPTSEDVENALALYEIPSAMLEQNYLYCYLKICPHNITLSSRSKAPDYLYLSGKLQQYISAPSYLTDLNSQEYMISISSDSYHDKLVCNDQLTEYINELSNTLPAYRFVLYLLHEAPLYSAFYAYELLQHYASQILTCDSTVIPVLNQSLSVLNKSSTIILEETIIQKWSHWLIQGRTDDVMRELKYQIYHPNTIFTAKDLSIAYYSLLHMLFDLFSAKNIPAKEIITRPESISDPSEITASIEKFIVWADQILHTVVLLLQKKSIPGSILDSVKQYIHTQISNPDMDRNSIANAVHVSPDYLSFLFHKETGTVLSSYIAQERIQMAQKLLVTTNMSLSAISESCGFTNDSYFHKQFKKITNLTPHVYRHLNQIRPNEDIKR